MRLIRSGALPPALNLALDEALLRSGRETLRLYAWDPPGLSLGFFQRAAAIPCPPGFMLVRRPTGGGAIAHTGELTIAWVGARRRVEEVYREMNAIVAAAAASFGVRVVLGEGEPEVAPAGLCFDAHTCYDLLAGGRKLFGSAQRRGGGRFLLHGTLPLERNPLSEGATSLSEAAGRVVTRAEAEAAVIREAEGAWGAVLVAETPSPSEWQEAERLVSDRYANDAWTHRR
ncbi:MAG TPA: biotin/lipoate A/B protein ligase family protein [Planctomycetota bacterium]|nr:biotin/lipoate A/B protein ligase family protein [Planctomycetota bacterium]